MGKTTQPHPRFRLGRWHCSASHGSKGQSDPELRRAPVAPSRLPAPRHPRGCVRGTPGRDAHVSHRPAGLGIVGHSHMPAAQRQIGTSVVKRHLEETSRHPRPMDSNATRGSIATPVPPSTPSRVATIPISTWRWRSTPALRLATATVFSFLRSALGRVDSLPTPSELRGKGREGQLPPWTMRGGLVAHVTRRLPSRNARSWQGAVRSPGQLSGDCDVC